MIAAGRELHFLFDAPLRVGDEIGWRTRLANASYSQIEVTTTRRALVSFNVTVST